MRFWLGAGLVCAVGCQLPPDHAPTPPDLATHVRFDAGPGFVVRDAAAPPDALMPGGDLAPPLSPLGTLAFSITDGDTQKPVPARVIFRPPPGAGFADLPIGAGSYRVDSPGSSTGADVSPGVVGAPEGLLLTSGVGSVTLPVGKYHLLITRGPEYEAVEATVTLAPGAVQLVAVELMRTVDTRGWLAADMHVHTKVSFDSKIPLEHRVVSMTTNGIEIIVPTEHNISIDFQPTIDALGYTPDQVGTVIGEEFNFLPGHGGAYPVTYDAGKRSGGVPTWIDPCTGDPTGGIQCIPPSKAFDIMHALVPGTTVVTINHPWWGGADLGYFTNVNWGAGTSNPLPATLDSAGKFDALEVLNGYWARDDAIGYLVADWFYLISQGYRVTALGNSDTHKINWLRAGWPRTWLRLPIDHPGDITGQLLSDAIKQGRAVASTGPFARLTVDNGDIGDTIQPAVPGQVTVHVVIDAPAWMTVDTVRVYVNGSERHHYDVVPGSRPVFELTFTEPLTSDSWFVLQADGQAPLASDVVGEVSEANGYRMRPWVITNPVFVDGDADGQFHPPPWQGGPTGTSHRSPQGGTWRPGHPVAEECAPELRDQRGEPPLLTPEESARQLMPLLYN